MDDHVIHGTVVYISWTKFHQDHISSMDKLTVLFIQEMLLQPSAVSKLDFSVELWRLPPKVLHPPRKGSNRWLSEVS